MEKYGQSQIFFRSVTFHIILFQMILVHLISSSYNFKDFRRFFSTNKGRNLSFSTYDYEGHFLFLFTKNQVTVNFHNWILVTPPPPLNFVHFDGLPFSGRLSEGLQFFLQIDISWKFLVFKFRGPRVPQNFYFFKPKTSELIKIEIYKCIPIILGS